MSDYPCALYQPWTDENKAHADPKGALDHHSSEMHSCLARDEAHKQELLAQGWYESIEDARNASAD